MRRRSLGERRTREQAARINELLCLLYIATFSGGKPANASESLVCCFPQMSLFSRCVQAAKSPFSIGNKAICLFGLYPMH